MEKRRRPSSSSQTVFSLVVGLVAVHMLTDAVGFRSRADSGIRMLSLADIHVVRDVLQDEHGWSLYRAYRAVKSPWAGPLLQGLFYTVPMNRTSPSLYSTLAR